MSFKYVWFIPEMVWFFVLGLVAFLLLFRNKEALIYLLLSIIPATLFFMFAPNKDPRYALPTLPILLVCMSTGCMLLKTKIIRFSLIGSFLVVSFYNFIQISFMAPPNFPSFTFPPKSEDWKSEETLNVIKDYRGKQSTRIAFLPEVSYVNNNIFILHARLQSLPYQLEDIGVQSAIDETVLSGYDVFITKSKELSVPFLAKHKDAFHRSFMQNGAEFYGYKLLSKQQLPDGSDLLTYVNLHK